jgi:hypothetical protein
MPQRIIVSSRSASLLRMTGAGSREKRRALAADCRLSD